MFPVTIDVVAADRSHRLESFATLSGGRSRFAGPDATDLSGLDDVSRPAPRHRAWHRPAFTR